MPTFKNIDSALAYISKSINKALQNNVAPVVEQTMQEQIKEKVYDSYKPIRYERRNVLGDSNNISSELLEDGVLLTTNTAQPNESVFNMAYVPQTPTIFAGWVNDGQVPNVFNNKDYPWMHPRDFIAASVAELQSSGAVTDALAKGLESSGIAVNSNVKRGG